MIRRISRRRVGTGFSFSQQTPTLHRSLSFFWGFFCFFQTTVLQDGFVLQDWNALTQHDESTGEAANLKQWRDVTQPKNAISMPPEKPSSPPSLHPSLSFLHFFISSASFYWGGIWWFQLFCQKKNVQCFFLRKFIFCFFFFFFFRGKNKGGGGGGGGIWSRRAQLLLTRRTWADLWVMIWSVYRCNPHPPITSHLSHGVWSHEEVNYCKELQEVLFFFFCHLLK